jgi:hypothetical protein
MDLKDMDWILLAEGRDQWQAPVSMVMNTFGLHKRDHQKITGHHFPVKVIVT